MEEEIKEEIKEEIQEAVKEVNEEKPKRKSRKKKEEEVEIPDEIAKAEKVNRAVEDQKEKILSKMSDRDDSGRRTERKIRFIKEENGKRYYEIDELRGGKVIATKSRVAKIT